MREGRSSGDKRTSWVADGFVSEQRKGAPGLMGKNSVDACEDIAHNGVGC